MVDDCLLVPIKPIGQSTLAEVEKIGLHCSFRKQTIRNIG